MLNNKKSPKANLENHRFTYVLMGAVLAVSVLYMAFEWTDKEVVVYEQTADEEVFFEEEMIEQTVQEEPQTPPPPPPPVPDVIENIEIVEDDVETADIEINSEDDQNQQQEIVQAPVAIEEDPEEDVVFMVVEKMPEFPGGQQALMRYFQENIRYPVIAQENGIQGRVIVQFTVRKDGQIDDIQVVRHADPSLDKEAVRLVKNMPPWNPGKQRGKAVHCKFTVPVVFKLQM